MENKNIIYVDILKIIASIAVVIIHVVAIEWYTINPTSLRWQALNIADSFCRWAVPIFVMASGILLLNPEKDITLKNVFIKYIKKIVILLVFWQIVYALVPFINSEFKVSIGMIVNKYFASHYHLWYLYMLIGLYLITPIIKSIIDKNNDKIIEYFLILWGVFQLLVPMINTIIYGNRVNMTIPNFNMSLIMGYVGYYILGYYLSKKRYSKKTRIIIYALAVLSVICIVVGTSIIKIRENTRFAEQFFYDYLTLPVCITAIAIYLIVRELCGKLKFKEKIRAIIKKIVKLSLGVYLAHPMFIIFMEKLNINMLKWNVLVAVPLTVVIVYVCSMALTYILSKIPIVGKYIT